MSKRKHDNDPAGRNVKKRIDNIQNVQILPAVDESQTVPIAFKYEEVTVNPTSSLLAPAVKSVKKKKKVKPAAPVEEQAPVNIDPATGLQITMFPSYGATMPGQNKDAFAYPYSAAPDLISAKKKEKKDKFVRAAGGEVWEDESLASWPKDDFRIFVGNLGNEVTDDGLKRAFYVYKSCVRAKVVRDKRTNKSKGFGFVSFLDATDFVRALREMNGKYIGNRPCKLTKSKWEERNITPADTKKKATK